MARRGQGMSRTGGHTCRHIPDFHAPSAGCDGSNTASCAPCRLGPRPNVAGASGAPPPGSEEHALCLLLQRPGSATRRAVALPTRSTMSGRRNTASSRVRRYGRSSSTAVRARTCSWVISSDLPKSEAISASRSINPSASPRQRRVTNLRVVVGRLAGPRDLVRRCRTRRVAFDRKAHLPGRFDDRRAAL